MSELKLLPCPFCGGEACMNEHVFTGYSSTFGVVCLDCCAETRQFYDIKEEAITAWNRRAEKVVCHTCELYNTPSYKYYTYPCSECKHRARDSYSPNCGARMEETNDAKRAEESERVKHTIEKGKADG